MSPHEAKPYILSRNGKGKSGKGWARLVAWLARRAFLEIPCSRMSLRNQTESHHFGSPFFLHHVFQYYQ